MRCAFLCLALCGACDASSGVGQRDAGRFVPFDAGHDAASVDAGGADAGSDGGFTDAATDGGGFVPGAPLNIVATGDAFALFRAETFPDAVCMDGSEAGLSVRLNPGATGLVIHFQGGGLCVDDATCNGVRNRNGFSQSDANGQILTEAAAILNSADPANPAKDYHHAFVHYCSGDFHAGHNPGGFAGARHAGRANTEAFLSRLAPTFSSGTHAVDVVLLSGSSAGALAALLNYPLIQEAFATIPVHAFIDAPPVADDTVFRPCQQQYWAESLGLGPELSPGCSNCALTVGGFEHLLASLLDRYPNRRFGWFSASEDAVLRCLAGNAGGTCSATRLSGADFRAALVSMRTRLAAKPNFKTYFYASNLHTALFFPTTSFARFEAEGVMLGDWIGAMLAGSASFEHVQGEDAVPQDNISFSCP